MKRLFAFVAAATLSLGAFAAPFSIPSPVPDFRPFDNVSFEVLYHFGWGFHGFASIDDPSFDNRTNFGRNREIFFNLFQLEYYPSYHNTISLGADLNWDTYRLNDASFWLPNKEEGSVAAVSAREYGYTTVKKATLRTFGFDIPLDYTHTEGLLDITVGVAAELNFYGRTKFKGINEEGILEKHTHSGDPYRATNIRTNTLTMNIHAIVTYDGFGLYFKYCPFPQFKEGYGPQFTTWTFGLLIR